MLGEWVEGSAVPGKEEEEEDAHTPPVVLFFLIGWVDSPSTHSLPCQSIDLSIDPPSPLHIYIRSYARKLWPASSSQRALATRKGQTWSPMPVAEASETFFTPAKLDHQV